MSLTDRQFEVYAYLRDYQSEQGYPPTLREICAHFGWSSTNSAACHLLALQAKGVITIAAGKPRAIRLLMIGENNGESKEESGEEADQEACA